jgi:cell cycle protein kinase DBF2
MTLNFGKSHIDWVKFTFQSIVESVNELHSNGYIHRDLKPSNFLIDSNGIFLFNFFIGNLKLNDFGLVIRKNT